MASMMMIALLIMGAFLLFRLLARKRSPSPQMSYAGAYTGGSLGNVSAPPFRASPMSAGIIEPVYAPNALPPGFDADAFVREAKLNFLRLQAAYDAGNLDDIREFTSPEMYAEISLQIAERGEAEQHTEVIKLNAEVIECAEEPKRHLVSVRFHGLIREEKDAPAQDFNEIWHLTRVASGNHGWVVAGIQQVS
jgi:predicted lipid-binding transport protein (Tim44 family)